MNNSYDFTEDFRETCENLIGDVVLLETLFLCRDQSPRRQSQEQFDLLVGRITGYLCQHTNDLLVLTRPSKETGRPCGRPIG